VFVATEVGIFKTTDSGATWTTANSGLSSLAVSGLFADPAAPTRLYAVVDDGVFQSTNGGLSWSALFRDRSSGALASGAGSDVYAGGEGVVQKSSDGGKTWKSYALRRKGNASGG
jgi:photosystem II stability/assembly factor-like uncharacterized protein